MKTNAQSNTYVTSFQNDRRCRVQQYIFQDKPILGYPGVIPLATSTPGTISWISFDVPLRHHSHFRMSKMTNENYPYKRAVFWLDRTILRFVSIFCGRFKAFLANCPRGWCSEWNHPWVSEDEDICTSTSFPFFNPTPIVGIKDISCLNYNRF